MRIIEWRRHVAEVVAHLTAALQLSDVVSSSGNLDQLNAKVGEGPIANPTEPAQIMVDNRSSRDLTAFSNSRGSGHQLRNKRSQRFLMNEHEDTSDTKRNHDEVAKKAYSIYEKEGRPQGHAAQNWSEAEGESSSVSGADEQPGKTDNHREGEVRADASVRGENTVLSFALISWVLLGVGFGLSLAPGSLGWVSWACYIGAYIFVGFFTLKSAVMTIRRWYSN